MPLTDSLIENLCIYTTSVLPLIDNIFCSFLFCAISDSNTVLIPYLSKIIHTLRVNSNCKFCWAVLRIKTFALLTVKTYIMWILMCFKQRLLTSALHLQVNPNISVTSSVNLYPNTFCISPNVMPYCSYQILRLLCWPETLSGRHSLQDPIGILWKIVVAN